MLRCGVEVEDNIVITGNVECWEQLSTLSGVEWKVLSF